MKFKIINRENISAHTEQLLSCGMSDTDRQSALDILRGFCEMSEDIGCECAVNILGDFILCRVYDEERYVFTFPIPFRSSATEQGCQEALRAIAKYTVSELIPLYFSDIDREFLELLTDTFPYVDAAAYADDEDIFSARVMNECALMEELPSLTRGDLTLRAIDRGCAEIYYWLCSDRSVNRYWGYDFRDDIPYADGNKLIDVANQEFSLGVALTLGVYREGSFIGEAVVFGFDYLGGAEIAIRLLPSVQGAGIGTSVLSALIELCRNIGLKRIFANVVKENIPSVRMTGKLMREDGKEGNILHFSLDL